MQHYQIPNQNFLLMSENERKKLIENYKKVFHRIMQGCHLIITVSKEGIFFSTDNDPSTTACVAEAFRNVTRWVRETKEEKIKKIVNPASSERAVAVCREWTQAVSPDFLRTLIRDDTVICITVSPVPRKQAVHIARNNAVKAKAKQEEAYSRGYAYSFVGEEITKLAKRAERLRKEIVLEGNNLCKVSLKLIVFGSGAEGKLNFLTDCAKDYGVYFHAPDEKLLKTALRRKLSGLNEICTDEVFGNLIPFTVQESCNENGFSYGVNAVSEKPLLYDRKRSNLPNGFIFGQSSGSCRNNAMWHEIRQVLKNTEDNVFVIDPTNYSERRAYDTKNCKVIRLFYDNYYINPLDVVITNGMIDSDEVRNIYDTAEAVFEALIERELTPAECNRLWTAVDKVFSPFIKGLIEKEMGKDPENNPTLKDIFEYLKNTADNSRPSKESSLAQKINAILEESAEEDKELSKDLKKVIEKLNVKDCGEDFIGELYRNKQHIEYFSHKTNIPESRLTVFQIYPSASVPLEHAAFGVLVRYVHMKVYREYLKQTKERNYNKRLWVYFEDINSWVRNSRANAALLLALWKRSRVYCGIITLCSTDYDSLINSEYGQSLICNTGFFLFLNQSETSRETIRKLHNFHEGEMEYLDGSLSTGLLFNNQSVIPLECRWDLDD